jgi:hypothetical protein
MEDDSVNEKTTERSDTKADDGASMPVPSTDGNVPDSGEEEKKDEGTAQADAEVVDEESSPVPEVPDPNPITNDGPKTESEVHREVVKEMVAQAMTLDVAYQSLETVRKVNLQVEFGKEVDDSHCIPCLRAEHSSNIVKSKFGKWMSKKAALPCLTCGTPVCNLHRSSEFGKQNITICSDCAHLFSVNYLVNNVMQEEDPVEKRNLLNYMLEVYDRALLVLLYSTQFIDEVVVALQGNTSRHNKIGLASSATGVVSGGLGVAAACTIFTPVGPPLLLASILFGGGATAVTAGSEAVNYRGEPNKMADRILTLHSIVSCIARLPGVMDMEEDKKEEHLASTLKKDQDQSRLHWARAAMHGIKPLTAGALSAISIVAEAREMKNTVQKIREGNQCEKAERLAGIKEEVKTIPSTDDLSNQLSLITSRQQQHKAADKISSLEAAATAETETDTKT